MQQGGETQKRFCSAFPSLVTESELCRLWRLVHYKRQSWCLDSIEWPCQVYFLVSDHFTINLEALGLPLQQLTAESQGSQMFHSAALQTPHLTLLTAFPSAWSLNISTAIHHCAKDLLIHGKDPAKRSVAASDRSTGGVTAHQEFSTQRQVYSTTNIHRFVNGHKFQ